jgi:uncharacterized protein (TIGR03067 family)
MFRSRFRGALLPALVVSALGLGLSVLLAQPPRDGKVVWKDGWEGPWSVVSWSEDGHPVPGDYSKAIQVTFRGQRVRFSLFGKHRQGPFKVDGTRSPGHFDMRLDGREQPRRAIYRLERDRLTLCFGMFRFDKRPPRFDSKPGSGTIVIVLGRGAVRLDAAEEKKARAWARLEEQKAQSRKNLTQLALAAIHHADTNKRRLPRPAITDKAGKPLLSWRVAILPYLEEEALYQQFKRDEPWDSPHNKKLLARMPRVYAPVPGKTREPHSTFYQAFVGPGTAFEPGRPIRFPMDITDGTSNTIFFAEAGEAVPWTRPADLPYDPKKPLPRLGGLFPDGFHVAMGDGQVHWVHRGFDERDLRAAITRGAGDIFGDILMPARGCLDKL